MNLPTEVDPHKQSEVIGMQEFKDEREDEEVNFFNQERDVDKRPSIGKVKSDA